MLPSGRRATTSVKVPPRSIQKCHCAIAGVHAIKRRRMPAVVRPGPLAHTHVYRIERRNRTIIEGISMRRLLPLLALTVSPILVSAHAPGTDPNLYLENIHGPRALATVKAWNSRTLGTLEAEPGFATYQ